MGDETLAMTDFNNATDKVYTFWQSAGLWVANHPKTALGIAIGSVVLAFILGIVL